jgi:hypothetical protein
MKIKSNIIKEIIMIFYIITTNLTILTEKEFEKEKEQNDIIKVAEFVYKDFSNNVNYKKIEKQLENN